MVMSTICDAPKVSIQVVEKADSWAISQIDLDVQEKRSVQVSCRKLGIVDR